MISERIVQPFVFNNENTIISAETEEAIIHMILNKCSFKSGNPKPSDHKNWPC